MFFSPPTSMSSPLSLTQLARQQGCPVVSNQIGREQ
jgi:hypothetical protein